MRIVLALLALTACSTTSEKPGPAMRPQAHVQWQRWGSDAFQRAKTENRIIVVAVETEWCHWCHVMEERTWADPEVAALLEERFVAIKEDADARPDLAERYADWGWPAIALLSPDAKPIIELRGYQERTKLLALLRGLVAKLDAGQTLARPQQQVIVTKSPLDAIHAFTLAQLEGVWDDDEGGWGRVQKYPIWANNDHHLVRTALRGDEKYRKRALFTLEKQIALIDPVDGGMFQYSLSGVWTDPHYEKLAEINGTAIGNYANAYALTRDRKFLDAARLLHRYVTGPLRAPDGAFYANQDADVGTRGDRPRMLGKEYYALPADKRRVAGAPYVDTNVYASHNGRIIGGLAKLAMATGDPAILEDAKRAASSIMKTHAIDGGYAHKAGETALHLADQNAMGAALLDLYEATLDDKWRTEARRVAAGMVAKLYDESDERLRAHSIDHDSPLPPRKPFRHNAEAARFFLKLGRLDGDEDLEARGRAVVDALASEQLVDEEGRYVGEYLLALEEARFEPLHFAVVGAHDDATRALHKAALALPAPHRLVDLHEPGEKYPDLGKPALYICGASFCSPPITDAALVEKKAAPFLKPKS